MAIRDDLAYYLERPVTSDEIAEAEEWQQDNPGGSLSEYVEAMIAIGAL